MGIASRLKIWRWDHNGAKACLNKLKTAALPRDTEFLLHVAEHGRLSSHRVSAADKLMSYLFTRKDAIRIALQSTDEALVRAVLEKLKYPEELDAILTFADLVSSEDLMRTLLCRIPYPDGKKDLISLAQGNRYPALATKCLDCNSDRTVLEDLALHSQYVDVRRAAFKKLDVSLSPEVMEQIALTEEDPDLRIAAVRHFHYPENRKRSINAW